LQAVEEMDAGPVWGSRAFPVPTAPPRKSDLYNGAVSDAVVDLIHEVLVKAVDPEFRPEPQNDDRRQMWGRTRPWARQADRQFQWDDPTEHIVRRIRASDGSPGVHASLCGVPVAVYDAHPGTAVEGDHGEPGTIAARRHGALLVRSGDGAVWVGHLRALDGGVAGLKLPATSVLGAHLRGVAEVDDGGFREISYRRDGAVGVVTFRFYNGAMSSSQSRRLEAALRHAVAQDTRVLLLRAGQPFSNGIHLGVIEAAADPASEAWDNIVAIDDVCRRIITCTGQLVVASVAGPAGAGGVMLALGADRVLLREGAVLNPHYRTMGLYGSEYWTYVLPRRVGQHIATSVTSECLPVGADQAGRIGLADEVIAGTIPGFEAEALRYSARLAAAADYTDQLARKQEARTVDEQRMPLAEYRRLELSEMKADIFTDRNGFAHARTSFIRKHVTRRAAA
jgi:putative two-component system hydrogenase maturation factor HypX/HoxX